MIMIAESLGAVHTHTSNFKNEEQDKSIEINKKEKLIKKQRGNYTLMPFDIKSKNNSLFLYYCRMKTRLKLHVF